MVKAPSESEISTSSGPTPASSQRIFRSPPSANMSVVGTQAVACVLRPSSRPPPSAYSRIRAISLIVSMTPRKGLRLLPTLSSFGSHYPVHRVQAVPLRIPGHESPHPAQGNEDRPALHLAGLLMR